MAKEKPLTDDEMWKLIDDCNWAGDHDYERIRKELRAKLTKSQRKQLAEFADSKQEYIQKVFNSAWLGEPGIEVSDDGWSDLTAEVVGRGRKFYAKITVKKLRDMVENDTYRENFMYVFN